jgi:hypothetical protein
MRLLLLLIGVFSQWAVNALPQTFHDLFRGSSAEASAIDISDSSQQVVMKVVFP